MLFRIFSKDTFEPITAELNQLFETLGISNSKLKIRTQPATYFKPYTHIVEGVLDGHQFVLSLRSSKLKSVATKNELEFIIHCKNPSWLALNLSNKKQVAVNKKKLGMEVVSLKRFADNNLVISCNQKAFVEHVFDDNLCQKITPLCKTNFSNFQIERKRLYYRADWLPNDANKRQILLDTILLSISLIKQIDNWEPINN
ncbi:MAG: hypothetical protein MK207_13060 [Saprospiraceae bacterium]|nr:hypothetical protein [Saprospiraceae bacterium]